MLMPISKEEYDPTPLIFSKLIDYVPQAIFWQNNQGIYIGCNKKYVEFLGIDDQSKILGLSDTDIQQKYFQSNQIKFIPQHANRIPLVDERGIKQGMLGIIDLNEINLPKQTHDLQGVYDQLREILDTIPVPVFWKDKNGYYQGCNETLTQLLQVSSESLCGQHDNDLYWHEFSNEWRSDDIYVMNSTKVKDTEAVLTRPDNTQIDIVISKVPLRAHGGEIIGIVGSIIDVSEQRKIQAKLQEVCSQALISNEAKNKIFTDIGYDLRAPLHGILGLSEILKLRNTNKEHDKLIAGVRQSSKVISYLVEDILSFAKQGTTKIELQLEPFDLRELILEVIDMLKPHLNEDKVEVIVSYSDTTPRYVINDFHAVRRILSNLIKNAIQNTDVGHIIVSVDPIDVKKDWAYLQIVVEDTGNGLPAKELEQLCHHFNSTEAFTSDHPMGLGLTVVRQLVRELGAKIAINSQENRGAIFQCSLPCSLQNAGSEKISQPLRHYLEMPVLMVDDNVVRGNIILDQIAAQEGHLATSQSAYSDMLTAQKAKQPYQVVIVDNEIQSQDAILFAQQVRAYSAFNKTMLVLCSAEELRYEKSKEFKAAGYFLIVPKPIHPHDLIHAVANAWERWLDSFMSLPDQLVKFAPKILLVEDNVLAQFATQTLLEDLGCQVEVATSGAETLKKSEQTFDLILMDVGLPDIDGITLTKEIRQRETDEQRVPIIALTAHVTGEQKQECFNMGMNHVLTKPTTRNELQEVICQVLFDNPVRNSLVNSTSSSKSPTMENVSVVGMSH